MSAIVLSEDARALVARMSSTAEAIGSIVEVHPLDSAEDETKAAELLRAIKTLIGQGEATRKALKAPHLKAGRDVDEAFRKPKRALERVEGLIKRRLAEQAERREAERTRALEAAREAVKAQDHETANAELEKVDIAGLDRTPEGISTRWTYEVESVTLSEVPAEYLILDMGKVRAEITAANREGREPKIPGVTFKKAASIAARRY